MLIGQYEHNLDDKNRLAIPAKLRRSLKGTLIITKGLDKCLFILNDKEWKKLISKISELPLGKKEARALSRVMLAGAQDVSLDSAGRVIIPEYLKKYASILKSAVIVGVNNRLEIWAKDKWDEYDKLGEEKLEEMAEALEL